MPRLALLMAGLNLVGYLIAMRFVPGLGLSSPRGGIFMFAGFLALALLMIWQPPIAGINPTERIEAKIGGWILLCMPPIWWVISAHA